MTNINSDIKIIGPGIWHILHTSAAYATEPEKMDEFDKLLEIVKKTIRCEECRKDLQDFIDKNPLSNYRTLNSKKGEPVGYYVWSWKLHNHVNTKLNKPQVNVQDSYKYYSGNSVCFSCIASKLK